MEDTHEFASVDTSIVWSRFPQMTHVLSIHGLKDEVVPPYVHIPIFSEGGHERCVDWSLQRVSCVKLIQL